MINITVLQGLPVQGKPLGVGAAGRCGITSSTDVVAVVAPSSGADGAGKEAPRTGVATDGAVRADDVSCCFSGLTTGRHRRIRRR